MTGQGREAALETLRADGAHDAAIAAFTRLYDELAEGNTGIIREEEIKPVSGLTYLNNIVATPEAEREALGATAVLRLNGGLGTSMGMTGPKSLLPARGDETFLDIIVHQVLALRRRYAVPLPLILMNSFATSQATMEALAEYEDLAVLDLPLECVQSREPKLTADTLEPVTWEADPELQWCPPGHGDLYPTLQASGLLESLQEQGIRYLFVANADNLGAFPDGRIAAWFADSGSAYAAEVTPRTPMDRKGGHLARRVSDDRLILRETAQTAPEDMEHFTDEDRHPYAHCNNLWIRLDALAAALEAHDGVLPLPLIRNPKTVDPRDPESTEVVQIESAAGAAVEVFEDATALVVPRERFAPVKNIADLLLLRSDVYYTEDNGAVRRTHPETPLPVIDLDQEHYRTIDDLDKHFPDGPPSLRRCRSLSVEGSWTFGAGVRCNGDVRIGFAGSTGTVPKGSRPAPRRS